VKARRNKIRKVLFAFHPQEALQKQRVWVRFAGFDFTRRTKCKP
jgi:hypothetical protein